MMMLAAFCGLAGTAVAEGAAKGDGGLSLTAAPPVTKAPRPWNELVRLCYLRSLGVLDTAEAHAYDSVTALCCKLLDMPMAAVELVDAERVWAKSESGFNGLARTMPRDVAFCSWVVAAPDAKVLVIPDTTKDARFCRFPQVVGGPRVRFYAGAPLVGSNGLHLGTLCVLDTQPRELDAGACNLLANLASLVVRQLEAPAMQQFDALQATTTLILGRCDDALCTLPSARVTQEA